MPVSANVKALASRFAKSANPVVGGPAAPIRTRAILAAFGPSLMPRASLHQGMAVGLSVLSAEVVGHTINGLISKLTPAAAPLSVRLGVRTGIGLAGAAAARIPETDHESTALASLRTGGKLVALAAVGGAIFYTGADISQRFPPKSAVRPVVLGVASVAAEVFYARDLLVKREESVQAWTADDKPASLAGSLGIGLAVATAGRGIGIGYLETQRAFVRFFGEDRPHAAVGGLVNAATWAVGGAAVYYTLVGVIARANETVESAYSTPPSSPYVSGGPNSVSPWNELGLEGRRFVTDVVTPQLIEAVMGEKAVATPVRAFVGYNSEPLYPSGRSEMMLDELERLGAFERANLILVSPTGTGWVDQTMVEAAEFFSRGDVATACVQFSRGPSFLEVQKVHLGRMQFRGLLWGVHMRLQGMPPQERPNVYVFGESLGSWSSSDVVMHQGIAGFDHYGIDRALWFGLVGFAKWSKTGMRQGSNDLVPPGTVEAFDNYSEYAQLTPEQQRKLRAIVVDHDNDPIAAMSLRWAVKRPPWLTGDERGRGVAKSMQWVPLITFVQIMVDAMNAMVVVPGHFKSFGHDYRGDTADFVHAAFELPAATDDQKRAVDDVLLRLEVERGERIKNQSKDGQHRSGGRTWLRDRGVLDQDEPAVEITPGDAPGDIQ